MKMQLPLSKVKPNPYRDFTLYPIDENHVERLRQSIRDLGFFSGVTARPTEDGDYELACGHHRTEAARREGLTSIEAHVEDYSDADMVHIMVRENTTQRGYNAAALLDSVAAEARLIAEVLLSVDFDNMTHEVNKILLTLGLETQESLDSARGKTIKDGPGVELIYRVTNGFDRKARAVNKDSESVNSTEIAASLAALKSSGAMARLMQEVNAVASKVNEDRIAAKEATLKAEQEAKDREAARIKQEEEAAAAAAAAVISAAKEQEEAAAREADAARKAADRQNTPAASDEAAAKKQKVKELAEARKAREAEAKARAEAAAKKAKEDNAAMAQRARALEDEKAKLAAQNAKIAAQADVPETYDIACMAVFRLVSHEEAFRKTVLNANGLRFIPKDQQLPLAKSIRARIDDIEKKRGGDLGSVTIAQMVSEVVAQAIGLQRDIDAREKEALLRASDERKVQDKWDTLRKGLQQAESAAAALAELESTWPYPSPFPVDASALLKLKGLATRLDSYSKKIIGT